ncbi:MAG TPA: VWA domain-containing protein [Thermoanaerobaculia bacterium]|nr:VWA domain-containing protein [Thermoanaerobaculia bacterium]
MLRRVVCAFSAAAFVALTAFAQQQPAAAETVNVQLTNLEVVVTDPKGARVSGLTATDFEVLENGQRREITNLTEIRRGPTGTDAGTATLGAPRRILVAIDNRTIPLAARKKTVAALRQTIDQLLGGGGDRLMLVTIYGASKPRTRWTSDRAEIDRVLTEIEQEPAMPRLEDAEINNMFADLVQMAQGNIGGKSTATSAHPRPGAVGSGSPTPAGGRTPDLSETEGMRQSPSVDYNLILTRARAFASSRQFEARQTLGALAASLNQFQAAPGGRRLVVLVGGQLPLFAGADIFQRLDSALRDVERHERSNAMSGATAATTYSSPVMEKTAFDVTKDVDALATAARMKGIAFYAVNPETNDKLKDSSNRFASAGANDFSAANATVDGFYRLASATGGEAHVGRNAEIAIGDIQRDLDTYYSLGYRSTAAVTPETKIVVKARGLNARATIAAAAVSPEWQVADQVLSLHFSEPTANELGISLVPQAAPVGPDGTRQIVVRVMIPFDRLALTKQGGEYLVAFSVFVSVGDANGGAQPQQETKNLKWNQETVDKLRGKSIAYGLNLTVGPGRDRVSVGMLDIRSGKTGYARTLLQ